MTALRILPVVALTTLATLVGAQFAHAQQAPTGIYYDYAQVTVGGVPQFVLIPRPTDAFRGDAPPQVSVPDAFRVLRENKRATYGNASLTLTDDDIAAGRVVVHIDPEQREWFQIVAAETVYTFTGLGMNEVVFPGVSETPMTRGDVPFAAFVLHVPLWRALPPARVQGAVVQLADGAAISSQELYERWDRGDRDLQEQVLQYLTEGGPLEQRGVLALLPELNVSGADEAVPSLLESGDPAVRLAAIEYLSARGLALDRLASLVESDTDPEVRSAAAAALGQTGDTHYQFFELQHALDEAGDAEVPAAIAALAATGDPRTPDVLLPYVSNPDPEIRAAALNGLISLGAATQLEALLRADDTTGSVRLEVAGALAENGQGPTRLVGQEYLLTTSSGGAAVALLEQVANNPDLSPDERRAAIERQLLHAEPSVRTAATVHLAEAGDADSLPALGEAAAREQDGTVAEAIDRAAVSILAQLPLDTVREYADGNNVFLKRAAYRALGQLASEGQASEAVYRLLREGLSESEPAVRGAAVLGLAAQANGDAFEAIQIAAADSDPGVRRDVARALAYFPAGQGTDILVGYLNDSDPYTTAAALDSLGARAESEYLPDVMQRTEAREAPVRAAALRAASQMSMPEVEMTIIDGLMGATNDSEAEVRAAAAQALSHFNSELAVLGISPLTQDRDMGVRHAAIEALGRTHHAEAQGVLENLLEDRETSIRARAAEALGELGRGQAAGALERLLGSETEPSVISAAQQALERLR